MMCLSVPGKIIKINGEKAVVDYQGEKREVSTALKKDAKIGDYVIVSAKFVMEIVPEDEALKTIEVWNKADEC
ncbi:MAG: HypC/HybG/HupF family hydrogenase formation chaperone [archaeon]